MLWLIIAIISYFFLAVVYLFDKYLLGSGIPNPKIFVFYVGFLGGLAVFIAPFVNFFIPDIWQIFLSLLSGIFLVYGLFWFYSALRKFEASRVISTIGGLSPIMTFGLVYLFSRGKEILSFHQTIAFVLLVIGSVLIVLKKQKLVSLESFGVSMVAAFLFSLSFVISKYVYIAQPFWNAFIWMRIGGVLAAFTFIFSPEVRKEIFSKLNLTGLKAGSNKGRKKTKTAIIFIASQAMGAGASILQNVAIAIAPLSAISIINALQGVQYVFLLFFTTFLSVKFPEIIKEEISKEIIFQKLFAILLICLGLFILAIK
ncbi:MAG TPA: DMT family transporter [Candidatus Parcubacteria bacterium]|nr:DMT family transporter [Candidatus Parcubacteria bacterium]